MIPNKWKRIVSMLLFGFGALAFVLACSFGGVPILSQGEQTPTSHVTRIARATFTPRPRVTQTPIPEPTEEPTEAPTDLPPPTEEAVPVTVPPPTDKPVVVQPTDPPPPPPPPPATDVPPPPPPPASNFEFSFIAADPGSCPADDPAFCNVQNGIRCRHSGQHTLEVLVFDDRNDPGSALAGITVRFSGSPGGPPIGDVDEVTNYEGKAEKILSTVLEPPGHNIGNYYAWLVDGSGNQRSDFSSVIPINDLQPENPQVCWIGTVAFAG